MTLDDTAYQAPLVHDDISTWQKSHAIWLEGCWHNSPTHGQELRDQLENIWDACHISEEEQLVTLCVLNWQQTYLNLKWLTTTEEERDLFKHALEKHAEQLWELMHNLLKPLARRWLNGPIAQEMFNNPASYPGLEKIVTSMQFHCFTFIVEALPKIKIDPLRNIQLYLIKIAENGLCDEYKKVYRNPPNQVQHIDDEQNIEDRKSNDQYEYLIIDITNQDLMNIFWEYCEQKLPAVALQIMRLRWNNNPPRPFKDIAVALGPGWTEATVRKQHNRSIQKIRDYFREKGLLNEE